jgi:hypothetical protein
MKILTFNSGCFSFALLLLVCCKNAQVEATGAAAAAASAGGALHALKSIDYRYFVAGGTCASFSHGITTPIDVVKTKMQANPKVKCTVRFIMNSYMERRSH